MIAFAPEKGTVAEFFRVDDHNPKFNKKQPYWMNNKRRNSDPPVEIKNRFEEVKKKDNHENLDYQAI